MPQLYGWKGRELIPGVNLYYNRARFYDPVLGRFTSEDPLGFGGGDTNLYDFAWDNPHNWNDPSGMTTLGYGATSQVAVMLAAGMIGVGIIYDGVEAAYVRDNTGSPLDQSGRVYVRRSV